MTEVIDGIRRRLIQRCRSRRTRSTIWSQKMPTEWQPETLRNPKRPSEYFTEDAAWEYLAELLEQQWPFEVKELNRPPGATGYVLIIDGHPPVTHIYAKLQLTAEKVIGRSFHESTK